MVSVVIPTYNYGRFIADAISSALIQTHQPLEIIVVDDGSTDETKAALIAINADVRYVRQENAGVCAARNRGVAESTGEYIAFLDADDIWEATKLEKQLARFASDEETGLVHCGMREFDSESGRMIKMHLDGQEGDIADELLLWEKPAVNVSGSVIMVSREAFDSVGGFDIRQKVGEDWDFCYRVAKRFKVGFVREPLVNYRSHRDSAHRNVQEMERGMKLFYEKAFANADPKLLKLKNRAYSNYHRVIAGSYFHAGDYGKFISHAGKSIWMRPANASYFFNFPFRTIKRKRKTN